MSFLSKLLGTAPDPREELRPLWQRIVGEARDPRWYANCGVADTMEGRFDMVSAVQALVLLRMERDPAMMQRSALLTELFVEDMDGQLRQSGVGDVVVGKHMGKLMGSMGGRLGAYREALAAGDDALAEAATRNVSMGEDGDAACVALGLRALANRLDETPNDALLAGDFAQ